MKDWNKPRCPVCGMPLAIWATVADAVRAECDKCEWRWTGG